MPRMNRRPRRRREFVDLSPGVRETLESGEPLFDGDAVQGDLATEWNRWGTVVLAEWIEARPGTRPAAWWIFEGLPRFGPRRQVRPGPAALASGGYWFGVPRFYENVPVPGQFETELEYLRRYDALTEDERHLLEGRRRPELPQED